MQPHSISVNVRGGSRKVKLHAGDNVHIHSFPGTNNETPPQGGTVLKVPSPTILSLTKNGRNVEATVRYHIRSANVPDVVSTHVVQLGCGQLETADAVFHIGDRVRVNSALPGVLVSVGTLGVILGGDGQRYHVSFTMTDLSTGETLEFPITVSQDGVPGEALEFVDSAPSDHGDESDSDKGDDSDSEHGSEHDEGEDELRGGAVHVPELQLTLPPRLRGLLFQQLDLKDVVKFANWMLLDGSKVVKNVQELEDVLKQFYLSCQPATALPEAHAVALEGLGASTLEMEALAGMGELSLQQRLARFGDMRH
jgi:hypothetical protein